MSQKHSIETYKQTVQRLYPCEDTINGGVHPRLVADELGRTRRQTTTQLRKLTERGELERLDGLRGYTYKPVGEDQ